MKYSVSARRIASSANHKFHRALDASRHPFETPRTVWTRNGCINLNATQRRKARRERADFFASLLHATF